MSIRKAAGGVLTAKQAPHRPGITPALGLRAGSNVSVLYRRRKERSHVFVTKDGTRGGIPISTAYRDWAYARAWLARFLKHSEPPAEKL